MQSNLCALKGILQWRMPLKVKELTVSTSSLFLVNLHLFPACNMPNSVNVKLTLGLAFRLYSLIGHSEESKLVIAVGPFFTGEWQCSVNYVCHMPFS